ncbi:hypothetical protein F0U61_11895 [Archangium violaceum]|uniref:hypothetical protein n=1 Tax=Archangium violaceum TaxID=83451 RepID=UPI002B2FBA26|nr:hypothetical protein F0U61_11895 [Archangium violaceum]
MRRALADAPVDSLRSTRQEVEAVARRAKGDEPSDVFVACLFEQLAQGLKVGPPRVAPDTF